MLPVDIDFSQDDGWAETRHVFLEGNDLPRAWQGQPRFVVSELGFGTGLNLVALAALAAGENAAGRPIPSFLYQTVEWQPRPLEALLGLAELWPGLAPQVKELACVYLPVPGWNRWSWAWGDIVLFVGDAKTLPTGQPTFEPAHCWFLDGYAPDRNPELWTRELLAWVGSSTKPGGTASTYSAAGVVKQGLREAGFVVERAPGWGRKRHMVKASR